MGGSNNFLDQVCQSIHSNNLVNDLIFKLLYYGVLLKHPPSLDCNVLDRHFKIILDLFSLQIREIQHLIQTFYRDCKFQVHKCSKFCFMSSLDVLCYNLVNLSQLMNQHVLVNSLLDQEYFKTFHLVYPTWYIKENLDQNYFLININLGLEHPQRFCSFTYYLAPKLELCTQLNHQQVLYDKSLVLEQNLIEVN